MTQQSQHVENMYNFKYFFNFMIYHKINNLLYTFKNDQKIKECEELKNAYITLFDEYPNREIV